LLSRLFMRSPEKGARTTVYLAASPDVEGVTGLYFDRCKPAETIALSHDVALQERLWTTSVTLTGVGADT
jgi:retinol dehydrogenase 12